MALKVALCFSARASGRDNRGERSAGVGRGTSEDLTVGLKVRQAVPLPSSQRLGERILALAWDAPGNPPLSGLG